MLPLYANHILRLPVVDSTHPINEEPGGSENGTNGVDMLRSVDSGDLPLYTITLLAEN